MQHRDHSFRENAENTQWTLRYISDYIQQNTQRTCLSLIQNWLVFYHITFTVFLEHRVFLFNVRTFFWFQYDMTSNLPNFGILWGGRRLSTTKKYNEKENVLVRMIIWGKKILPDPSNRRNSMCPQSFMVFVTVLDNHIN